jgi:hypothetical protein
MLFCEITFWVTLNFLATNTGYNSLDTAILAKTDKRFVINSRQHNKTISFKSLKENTKKGSKIYLLFDSVKITESPEGVYEVYLTPRPVLENFLTDKSPYFAGVIDFYSLQNNDPTNTLVPGLNITGNWRYLTRNKSSLNAHYYVTIIFRGNISPGKKVTPKAGNIYFQKIWIAQVS